MNDIPPPPYGIFIWATRITECEAHVMIFGDCWHNDERCPYGKHWDFQFSGLALFLFEHARDITHVNLSKGHSTRGGFFISLKGYRPREYPVLITDAVETQVGPVGTLRFHPVNHPSVEWAGFDEDSEPIYYGVLSDGWFGLIQFTSIDTAYVQTFSLNRFPKSGDPLYFSENFEKIGTMLAFDPKKTE
jgi:hypothetical protein